MNFAIADAIAKPFDLYEAIFICDDAHVSNYVLSLGAREEIGKRVFTLKVRS